MEQNQGVVKDCLDCNLGIMANMTQFATEANTLFDLYLVSYFI